jgi:hypothetical protein
MTHPHTPRFNLHDTFYSSLKATLQTRLQTPFVGRDEVLINEDGTSRPSFVILSPGKAEEVISAFNVSKQTNRHLSAVFVMGEKAAKSPSVWPLLKGMRVVAQGKKGPEVPYSYIAYHAPPQYHVTFTQAFVNKTLKMVFNVVVHGTKGRALFDTGATHCFVRSSFLNSLGIKAHHSTVNIQLADGQTMKAAGTAWLRVRLSSGCTEYRKFIVCDTLLDGVDLIMGQDFLSARGVILDYGTGTCFLRTHNHYTALRTSPSQWGNQRRGPPLVIGAAKAVKAMRRGAHGFWGLVRPCNNNADKDMDKVEHVPLSHLSPIAQKLFAGAALASGEDNPWEQDMDSAGLVNENSLHAIRTMDKPPELRELLLSFIDRFPEKLPELPPERTVQHTIPMVSGHTPPCRPTYRLAPVELEECKKQVEELLQQGFIRPSVSPYGSPILFVRKKEGTFRMVIDYRQINNLTIKDKYPLPRIDDLLDRLQGAQVFSSFDLLSGYHQVRLLESDVAKTAFRTPFGSYEFLVLPFGLTNAPATFQRMMNSVFHDFIKSGFVIVYLDDLLVFSKTQEEHLAHVRKVLERLREHKLYAKLVKCHFMASELKYLGHVVGRDGIKPDPDKVQVIKDWPTPTGVHSVRQFLGLANYFRKFIRGYSAIAAPLTALTSAKRPWIWGEREAHAFATIKEALSTAPVLALPDPTKPYAMQVISDASDFGVGAVLLQEGRPVAYFSKKLNQAERNYSTTEKELAGVLYALKEWRCYLLGRSFKLTTDHKSNAFLQEQSSLSPRRARWAEFLQNFDIEWEWAPGRTNPADPLSRLPHLAGAHAREGSLEAESLPVEGRVMEVRDAAAATTLRRSQREVDEWLSSVRDACLIDPWLARRQNRRKVTEKDGLYYHGSRVYVPSHAVDSDGVEYNLRREVLENLHGPPVVGHRGRDRTIELVARSWWWPGMNEDVADFVAHCDSCQRVKASTQLPAGLLHPLEIPARKWQSMSMDLITGLPKSRGGFDAIWVAVDRLSKCAHFAATTTEADAVAIAKLMRERVFTLHGFPAEIVSDRDPRWTGKFSRELFKLTGCRSALSTAFHPQTDGQTERLNRILEDYLRHYVTGRYVDWDHHLCEAEFAYNNTWQVSINATPFQLTFGQDPRIPFQEVLPTRMTVKLQDQDYVPAAAEFVRRMREDLDHARQCLKAAQDRMKAYADRHRREPPSFQVGDEVLLSTKHLRFPHSKTRKLLPRFIGPFQVDRVVSPVAFKLRLPKHMRVHNVFHVSMLKPYRRDGSVQPPPPPDIIDGEFEYEVEM